MKRFLALLLFPSLFVVSPALAVGEWGLADYGYEHRANGMDWDDDFVYGEAVDDGKACDDADTDGATIVYEDVDGDGYDEAQIYVIPATGTDDSDCGGPNAADACATVQYVLDNRMDTGSDHSGEVEDIICLVGAAHEELSVGDQDGDAGTKTRTATGDEVYDFQYPSNPNVLMGADRDQDGNYPPFDPDDTAVFDGAVGASYLNVFLLTQANEGTTDRWEFAHFTVQEYGIDDSQRDPGLSAGMFHATNTPGGPSYHQYYHDIYGWRIAYLQESLSFTNMMYELWSREYEYHAIENVSCYDCCGYVMRGQGGLSHYLRFRNTSVTYWCEDNPEERIGISVGTNGVKAWGQITNIELINNDWDFDVSNFVANRAEALQQAGGGMDFNTCSQDVFVVNNRLSNMPFYFSFSGGLDGQCNARYSNNLNFLRNYCATTVSEAEGRWPRYTDAIRAKPGLNSLTTYTQNVTVANNMFIDESGEGWLNKAFTLTDDVPEGAPDPSEYTIAIVNNTFYSENYGESPAATEKSIFDFDDDALDQSHHFVITNNIIAGVGSDDWFIRFQASGVGCDEVEMDYNIYEDAGGDREWWACDGQRYDTLALYSAATGWDTHSKGAAQNACDVSFANRGSDMHLATGDTCAQEEGTSVSAYTTIDFDRDSRPQNTHWDIGADEYASGYSPKGACCGSSCSETTEATCPGLWQGAGTTCTPALCEPPVTQLGGEVAGATLSGVTKQ